MEPDLEMLINHGEDTKVEYKRTLVFTEKAVRAEMARDLLAMVNAHEQGTGYILIGVDEGTKDLYDAAPLGLDDGKIHSFVDEFTDPPIPFSFAYREHNGVALGVIEVRPSADRFHMVKKDLTEGAKYLLTQGETWIRSGARRRRLTAWDMRRLKDDHAKQFAEQPQPNLVVTFTNGATETEQNLVELPGYRDSLQDRLGTLGEGFLPRRTSGVYVVEAGFRISNMGNRGAEEVHVKIELPPGCKTVRPRHVVDFLIPPAITAQKKWHQWSDTENSNIKISGSGITHGLAYPSDSVYFHFDDPSATYELKWTARASNMMRPTKGILRVLAREEPRRQGKTASCMTPEELFKTFGAQSGGGDV